MPSCQGLFLSSSCLSPLKPWLRHSGLRSRSEVLNGRRRDWRNGWSTRKCTMSVSPGSTTPVMFRTTARSLHQALPRTTPLPRRRRPPPSLARPCRNRIPGRSMFRPSSTKASDSGKCARSASRCCRIALACSRHRTSPPDGCSFPAARSDADSHRCLRAGETRQKRSCDNGVLTQRRPGTSPDRGISVADSALQLFRRARYMTCPTDHHPRARGSTSSRA